MLADDRHDAQRPTRSRPPAPPVESGLTVLVRRVLLRDAAPSVSRSPDELRTCGRPAHQHTLRGCRPVLLPLPG